jgi:preprotein translocase subunit SecE
MSAVEKVQVFVGEVKTELKKVSWPAFESSKESTGVVVVTVFIITVFIAVVDLILNQALGLVMG